MRSVRVAVLGLLLTSPAFAGVGDPQIKTDHPWYPGELSCSTFERLFATQAALYHRVTGIKPTTDEHKAIAAWLWRNANYWHGEEGFQDLWGKGFTAGQDQRTREYWTGLFAHGFGLCGTTHSQWTAEMNALFGPNRGRGLGVEGHNSFEVFLTGGPYGAGKWVLLDHDISTIIYDKAGKALLSAPEVKADWKRLTDRGYSPEKQNGWLVCGLDKGDGGVYAKYGVAEYYAGYAGPPPMVHLRKGETLRRYLNPGMDDGKTFAFWGRNYKAAGIPGPERSQTWVNQPEKMYKSRTGTGYKQGQARYANAVYTYKPDFAAGGYREAVVEENDSSVVFEFTTPFIIAAAPADDKPWGVYQPGCKSGLVLSGKADCAVSVSVDRGRTWIDCGSFSDGLDLTDHVKGRRQYRLKLAAGAKALAGAGLVVTTACQVNSSVIPQLHDGANTVSFAASGQAVVSAGPNLEQAKTHVVAGGFGTNTVTLKVATPKGEPITGLYAAAHINSGNPPRPEIKYKIDWSADDGKTWKPVSETSIVRRGDEPPDFWSQSICSGSVKAEGTVSSVLVRFTNTGGKQVARAEAHLTYKTAGADGTKVTFDWTDDAGPHRASHVFPAAAAPAEWKLSAGKNVKTRWVEFEPAGK